MQNNKIRYSLLIPVYNGAKYLPTCVETIISQKYEDYELLISNDHSTDDTEEYLNCLNHPNIRILHPLNSMSMAEHWEWLLAQASGEWVIFIGQDDGVQPYFFTLADKLINIAVKKGIRSIMSKRAYYFWKGCEDFYGDLSVNYDAKDKIKILNSKYQALLSLLGFQDYFELPEMYTTSLFHRSLIEEAIEKQEGRLFLTHPQDANLAAIACSLEKKYLKSLIPLGWVGSSPKSAGLAVTANLMMDKRKETDGQFDTVRKDYIQKTSNSKLSYHPLAGDFSFGSCIIYFWGALLSTCQLRKNYINTFLKSRIFKNLLFAGVMAEIKKSKIENRRHKICMCKELIELNKCNYKIASLLSILFPVFYKIRAGINKINNIPYKLCYREIKYLEKWSTNPGNTMINSSRRINELIKEKKYLESIK